MELAVIFLTTVCTVVLACCAQENIVAKLKAVIEQRLSVPVDQQTLYFQEQMMHNDSVLNRISGLDHGGMVYLATFLPHHLQLAERVSGESAAQAEL